MKHLILGTAGHVDHGKTTLVKALTGVDTDRLPEEKARGMTIELGFTHLDLPSGISLGVVDMPGHEKFIKHMAAGAGGVDIALLVVAADEGIMRQTEEHLEILGLLGICEGVVAITKSDLADSEWLMMVREDIESRLLGTELEHAAIVEVSAASGQGMGKLIAELEKAAERAMERSKEPASRLYIDRAFSITGHGSIVTGTLLGGPVREGDKLELLPLGKIIRVKQLEVHDRKAELAERGQRVALNITGVDKDEIERGMALATPGWLEPTSLIDVEVRNAKGVPGIEHGERLRLHIGTSEVICRARVPKQQPGGSLYIQLETETPVYPVRGDRFILRSYSPQVTLAGGSVLLAPAPRRKVGTGAEASRMASLSPGSGRYLAALAAEAARYETKSDSAFWPISEQLLKVRAYIHTDVLKQQAQRPEAGMSILVAEDIQGIYYMEEGSFLRAMQEAAKHLGSFHAAHPLRRGMPKEELRQKLAPETDRKQAVALIAGLCDTGRFRSSSDLIWLSGHDVVLDEKAAQLAGAITDLFKKELLSPPDPDEVLGPYGTLGVKVMEYLLDQGVLVKASSDVTLHRDAIDAALAAAAGFDGAFTAALLRDALGTSRKYAIAMLEWMDSKEYTQRSGDTRILKPQYRGLKSK